MLEDKEGIVRWDVNDGVVCLTCRFLVGQLNLAYFKLRANRGLELKVVSSSTDPQERVSVSRGISSSLKAI